MNITSIKQIKSFSLEFQSDKNYYARTRDNKIEYYNSLDVEVTKEEYDENNSFHYMIIVFEVNDEQIVTLRNMRYSDESSIISNEAYDKIIETFCIEEKIMYDFGSHIEYLCDWDKRSFISNILLIF